MKAQRQSTTGGRREAMYFIERKYISDPESQHGHHGKSALNIMQDFVDDNGALRMVRPI